jgi:hypothetical protein
MSAFEGLCPEVYITSGTEYSFFRRLVVRLSHVHNRCGCTIDRPDPLELCSVRSHSAGQWRAVAVLGRRLDRAEVESAGASTVTGISVGVSLAEGAHVKETRSGVTGQVLVGPQFKFALGCCPG